MTKIISLVLATWLFHTVLVYAVNEYITMNPERYFRVILKYTQDAIGLHFWDKNIKYEKLIEAPAKITYNCDKKLNEHNLNSIAVYKFEVDHRSRLKYLDGRIFIIAPPMKLPLKKSGIRKEIGLLYPILNKSVAVSRCSQNGFWLQIIDAAGWANKYNVKLDIENGQEDQFQDAMETAVDIEEKEYEKICPYF